MRGWVLATAVLGVLQSAAADDDGVYAETTRRYARFICSGPGRTDFMECVPALLERWEKMPKAQREAAVKSQAAGIAKACKDQFDEELTEQCALGQAVAMGDSYVHPAAPRAIWDIAGQKLKTETASIQPVLDSCRRLGWHLGEPRVGMTVDQAKLCGWGLPLTTKRETTSAGTAELWSYPGGRYLKLFRGKVQAVGE